MGRPINCDPFDSITKLCQIPPDQEQYLKHCPFAVPVASTGNTMVSSPPTPEDKQMDEKDDSALTNDDIFQTPPDEQLAFLSTSSQNHRQVEQQQITVDHGIEAWADEGAGNRDELVAVDPAAGGNPADGKGDKDLGFTVDAELTERIEIERESYAGVDQSPSQDEEVIQKGAK